MFYVINFSPFELGKNRVSPINRPMTKKTLFFLVKLRVFLYVKDHSRDTQLLRLTLSLILFELSAHLCFVNGEFDGREGLRPDLVPTSTLTILLVLHGSATHGCLHLVTGQLTIGQTLV